MKNQMIYLLVQLVLLGQSTFAQHSTSTASVTVDAGSAAAVFPQALL